MKRFLTYIGLLILVVLATGFVFEYAYTYVYNNGAYRNKVMWIRDMEGKPALDYIILGSSRANNHLNPEIINTETGLYGLNLAYNASSPFEINLTLKQFLKVRKAKKIFVQVDDQYYKENPDGVGKVVWLPYIKESFVYDSFKEHEKEYSYFKNIPFYRYQNFESRLGYRNVIPSVIGSGIPYNETKGFRGKSGVLKNDVPHKPKEFQNENKNYKEIIQQCAEQNIELVFFTAPIYRLEGNFDLLNSYLPNYHDMSGVVIDINLFTNHTHLNEEGANVYTEIFTKTFFKIDHKTLEVVEPH